MAHITGGGFTNLLRIGKFNYSIEIKKENIPAIFSKIQSNGKISDAEMFRTFNMGVGYVIIVNSESANDILENIRSFYPANIIGTIKEGNKVTINNLIEYLGN